MDLTEVVEINSAKENPKNFRPLYERYFRRIFLFILHRVSDRSLANDITSQVFLNALSNIHKYSHQGLPFSSWLFRIAINECNGHFKQKSIEYTVILDHTNFNHIAEEMDLSDEDRDHLSTALQALSFEDLELIELRFFEEMRFQEIADIKEITENNAKVRLYRALDKLRKKMNIK
ncbi:MAG: sigma-70 family RNA polymerase sigma factor [Marinoscillum sp.]